MKEPVKPWPPIKISEKYSRKFDFEELLIKYYMADEDNMDDFIQDMQEWEKFKGKPLPEVKEFSYDNVVCTLADILNTLPPNTDPRNVEISLHRPRYIDHVEFRVSLKKPTNSEVLDELYNKDLCNYQASLVKYEKDIIEYREWVLKQEIHKKEQELEALKKKITNQ